MTKTISKAVVALGVVAGLGVAILPLSTYAANPEDVTVQFQVSPTISGGASICSAADGGALTAGTTKTVTCDIGYSANSASSVSIKDKDSNLNLVSGANNIAPIATPVADIATTAGTAGWGYKFAVTAAGAGSNGLTAVAAAANYAGITASAVAVGNATAAVTNAAGTFTFGVSTAESTPSGTYSDIVTVAITAS